MVLMSDEVRYGRGNAPVPLTDTGTKGSQALIATVPERQPRGEKMLYSKGIISHLPTVNNIKYKEKNENSKCQRVRL